MKTDFVYPDRNEEEFIEVAEKLGFDTLVFLYKNKIPKKEFKTKTKILFGSDKKGDVVVVDKPDKSDFKKAHIITGLEYMERKDSMHYRRSGLNEGLIQLAKKHNTRVGVSFFDLTKVKDRKTALGRIIQNKRLCKKYKIEFNIYSFARKPIEMKSFNDLKAFLSIL